MGNYLRVRGEYIPPGIPHAYPGELPPRARRIQTLGEKARKHYRNYLRVRGEYTEIEINILPDTELPPRARRIP